MKQAIIVTCLVLLSLQFAADIEAQMTEVTARTWMAGSQESRVMFVLGYVNGVAQVLARLGWELRQDASRQGVNAVTLSESVYSKLVSEPELRAGSIREILFQMLSDFVVVTDRSGRDLPTWQRILTTSECADLLEKYRGK